jgi:upstream activation factor subunit UAF30
LILERFDIFNARQQRQQEEEPKVEKAPPALPATNGYHPSPKSPTPDKSPAKREAPSEVVSKVMDESPPKKKRKEPSVDADAAFAARLQAEEDKRARPTRGGGTRKAAPVKKKTPKKKTAARIRGSDDSAADDSQTEKKTKNTGFNVSIRSSRGHHELTASQKPMNLSPALSALTGETAVRPMSSEDFVHANLPSYLDHNASNASGNTSARTSCRTPTIKDRSSAMSRCVKYSSKIRSTCSP